MKKSYKHPDFETVLWNSDDDIITASGDTVEDLPIDGSGEEEDGVGAF